MGNGAAVSGGGGMVRGQTKVCGWAVREKLLIEYALIMSQIFVIKPVFFRLNQLLISIFRIWGIIIKKKLIDHLQFGFHGPRRERNKQTNSL